MKTVSGLRRRKCGRLSENAGCLKKGKKSGTGMMVLFSEKSGRSIIPGPY